MKREIRFKAKSKETGEWVFGMPIYKPFEDKCFMFPPQGICGSTGVEVDPDTVSQYIGSTDANGTEIYEGDILGDVKFPKATPLICEFRHGAFGYEYCGDFHPWGGNTNFTFNPFDKDSRFEITGNVHDKNS